VDVPVVDVVDVVDVLVVVVVVVVVVLVVVVLVVVVGCTAGPVGGGAVSGRPGDGPLVPVGAEAGDVVGGRTVACSRLGWPASPTRAVGPDRSPPTFVVGTLPFGAPSVTTWRAAG